MVDLLVLERGESAVAATRPVAAPTARPLPPVFQGALEKHRG